MYCTDGSPESLDAEIERSVRCHFFLFNFKFQGGFTITYNIIYLAREVIIESNFTSNK